jgi:hypothetical protein
VLPSAAILVVVLLNVMVATPTEPVGVHCDAVLPLSHTTSDALPPQAASNIVVKVNQAIIENLRISKHPSLTSCPR